MDQNYAEFLYQKLIRDYNAVSHSFSSARGKRWNEMEFLFNDYLKSGDRVLDLGCGDGRYYKIISEKGAKYFGVDISENLLKIAGGKYPKADFRIGDGMNLPFPDSSFDKVYSISVLHHIPSEKRRDIFLKEIRRVLRPGGFLIIAVWNLWEKPRRRREIYKNMLWKILGKSKLDFKDAMIEWLDQKKFYFHCFTLRELKNRVLRSGFEIKGSGKIWIASQNNSNFYVAGRRH